MWGIDDPMMAGDEHRPGPRDATLVLGMHRSGTSALTRVIGSMGATLPSDPNPPAADNPEGYWEAAGLVAAHDAALQAAGSAWFDTRPFDPSSIAPETLVTLVARIVEALDRSFGAASHWVIKDPRICRFLPLLRGVLSRLGLHSAVVLALRPPAEVAASLAVRDQITPAYAGLLWARHVIEAERDSRDLPRVVVTYADLLADWRAVAANISRLPGNWTIPKHLAPPINPTLRHHHDLRPNNIFGEPVAAALHELDAALTALAARDGAPERAAMDAAAAPVLALSRQMAMTLEAEFLFQRLTSQPPLITAQDPVADRKRFAGVMQRLHATHRAVQPL
ncbi:sulfotransferase family protein [Neoroseomonas soli]|uniref:Sulfotransferase family protein n=1 Tax=Neoroseomonas soli TaxID=1081025 RepID=A0A9X9X348_9PROT|nr:hypothetical protein [Neoroseomonas soli]MBR0673827.1 sulfotransferase family protein [Neoroseomonas soli]